MAPNTGGPCARPERKQPLVTLVPVSRAMSLDTFKTALLKKRCAAKEQLNSAVQRPCGSETLRRFSYALSSVFLIQNRHGQGQGC
jgi:hypothetical protein